ncbi:MAG: hypothetical protein RL077_6295 [Verrucomicrobiota bacterium]|jgi:hypothetical protein
MSVSRELGRPGAKLARRAEMKRAEEIQGVVEGLARLALAIGEVGLGMTWLGMTWLEHGVNGLDGAMSG